jgi:hypothetical protein
MRRVPTLIALLLILGVAAYVAYYWYGLLNP